jgi:hypothetical protein
MAPTSIRPSSPRFITPDRSVNIVPRTAKSSGVPALMVALRVDRINDSILFNVSRLLFDDSQPVSGDCFSSEKREENQPLKDRDQSHGKLIKHLKLIVAHQQPAEEKGNE